MFLAFFRSGLVTEADWDSWKNEDFQPYIDVSGTYYNIPVCGPSWSMGALLYNQSRSLSDCLSVNTFLML